MLPSRDLGRWSCRERLHSSILRIVQLEDDVLSFFMYSHSVNLVSVEKAPTRRNARIPCCNTSHCLVVDLARTKACLGLMILCELDACLPVFEIKYLSRSVKDQAVLLSPNYLVSLEM